MCMFRCAIDRCSRHMDPITSLCIDFSFMYSIISLTFANFGLFDWILCADLCVFSLVARLKYDERYFMHRIITFTSLLQRASIEN